MTVQNTGNADLIINSITVDCPCSSFQFLAKDGKPLAGLKVTVPPGDKIDLKLTFDTSKTKHVGAFTKMILIENNDPEQPVKRIKMVGEILKIERSDVYLINKSLKSGPQK